MMETLQKITTIKENDQRSRRKTVAALFELMRNTNDTNDNTKYK
jgi:hypothetical protein